jgi:hypothetical protein
VWVTARGVRARRYVMGGIKGGSSVMSRHSAAFNVRYRVGASASEGQGVRRYAGVVSWERRNVRIQMLVVWIHMWEMDVRMSARLNLDLDVLLVNQGNALKYVVRGHLTIITINVMMGTIRMVMVVINYVN